MTEMPGCLIRCPDPGWHACEGIPFFHSLIGCCLACSSAYREPSFGHAILTVYNATTALWQW